ncbi:MAG: AAA family ATPase [Thermoguttaceae bacterium]|nr:AAA family ATPase [Thermoguttaceae bacterium]
MRIDEAEIVSYGESTKRYFDFSGRNFWLAFGPNEAGKSTFLEFARNLLFDVPSGGGERFFSGVGATTLSGKATFRLDDGRVGRLERTWKLGEARRRSTFAATLRDSATGVDAALDEAAFYSLLNGANRRFFASYFGFSYEDLAQGEKLLAESGLSELIYGIGLGGANLFNETKKALKKELDAFFNADSRASKPKINAAVKRLTELDKERKKAAPSTREYVDATKERAKLAQELETLRERRRANEERRRYWERLRNARKRFEEAEAAEREAAAFLAASAFAPERLAAFPSGGATEWNALSETNERLQAELAELNENLDATQTRLERIELRPAFVAEKARIQRAFQRVEEIARERDAAPLDEARLRREADALERRALEAGVEASRLWDGAAGVDVALEKTLERARRGADEERKVAEEARTAAKMRRDRLDELDEIEREAEAAATRRVEEFGERDRSADVADYRRVEGAFGALRGALERWGKEAAPLDASRREGEKTARRLIAAAFDETSETSSDPSATGTTFAASLTILTTADAPLEATLEELERTNAAAKREIDAAREERRRLAEELARLDERLTASTDWEASAEELARLRRERDERWRSLKARWFGEGKKESEVAREEGTSENEAVAAFERVLTDADAVADYRCENAKSLAEWEAARAERTRKAEVADAVAERARRAEAEAEDARRRAVELWRRAGIPLRVDFSLDEGREWRALWSDWRLARREAERRESDWQAEGRRLENALREAFETSARWLDDERKGGDAWKKTKDFAEFNAEINGEAGEEFAESNGDVGGDRVKLGGLGGTSEGKLEARAARTASASRRVERLLERARNRVERWLDGERAAADRARRRAEAEARVRRFELDERAAAEAEAALATRRRALCVEAFGGFARFGEVKAFGKVGASGENGGVSETETSAGVAANSFAELAETLEKRSALRVEAARIVEARRALEERKARLAEFDAECGALATALGVDLAVDGRTRTEDAVVVWADRLQDALVAEKDWRNETRNRDEATARIGAKTKAIAANEERKRALLATVGATSDVEFLRVGEAAEEARRLNERRDGAAELLRAVFEECDDVEFERRLETLREAENDEPEARLAELDAEDAAFEADVKRLELQEVEIRAKIRAFEEKEGASRFSVEREAALSGLREAVELYAPRFLAFQALENSLRRCEEEKRPQILEDAEAIFSRLTAGRYSRIVANVGDGSGAFKAVQRDGVAKTPRELSSGTREQLYLALRLAHIRKYCENAESLPLLTDDAFVNFDDARCEEALRVLAEFAENRQVILLTCRESTRAAFERIVGADSVTLLAPKRFNE